MKSESGVPPYSELRYIEELSGRVSWGVFGDNDDLGTVRFIETPEVVAAAAEIKRGDRFSLSLPLNEPNPPPGDRQIYRHHIVRPTRNTQDDWLDGFYLSASTQLDGLRQVQAREFGFYNGVKPEDAGPEGARLGIEHWATFGIMTRGVLVDVEHWVKTNGGTVSPGEAFTVTPPMLQEVLDSQKVTIRKGDVLLIRTGYLEAFRAATAQEQSRWDYRAGCPGLAGSEDMAEWFWDNKIAAVCADTPSVEVRPGDPELGSLHRRAIAMLGMPLGELFDLEALAKDCHTDGRFTAFFVAAPLNLPGGAATPANAMACK